MSERIDLMAEWLAALGKVEPRHVEWMIAHGVASRIINLGRPYGLPCGAAVFGVTGIEPVDNQLYQPSEDGFSAVIVRTDVIGFDATPTDLVAFRPTEPARWWRRIGADALLNGDDAIDRAQAHDERLFVFETPLDWMRVSCFGCVVLDPDANLWREFTGIREIIADVPFERAAAFDRQLRPPTPSLPKLTLPEWRCAP